MDIFVQFTLNSIIAGGIYALIALGFNLIYGTTKFFNFAHGVLAAVGGYAVFYLMRLLGFDSSLGIVIVMVIVGCLAAAMLGFLLDYFIYRTLRRRKASNMILLVASLGAFTAIQAIIAILFTSQFQMLGDGLGTGTFEIFGGIITQVQLVVIVIVIVIVSALHLLLYKTKFGKAVRAISNDEEVAKIAGINTDKIIGRVFAIGSAVAGLAGILVGFDTGIEPTMGMSLLLKGVIASIIGGIGNVWGGVLGGFLLGFVENFGIWKISGEWKDAIAFGLLILFLLFRPQGILKR